MRTRSVKGWNNDNARGRPGAAIWPAALLIALSGLWTVSAEGQAAASPVFSGQLDVLAVDDFDRGRSEFRYYVHDEASGQSLRLLFRGQPPRDLKSGDRVTARGRRVGQNIEVESLDAQLGSGTSSPDGVQDAAALALRRPVLLMVDLEDAFSSTRYTPEQVAGQMYTNGQNVDDLYRTASWGQLGFDPDTDGDTQADIFGPFAIAASGAGCNYYDWAYQTEAQAEAAGVDLGLYQHRVFILPRYNELGCNWAGVANVGCTRSDQYGSGFCRAWIAEAESGMVLAHELGHNLNLAHASTDPDNNGSIDSEYGDNSDPMGISRSWHQFNAPHVQQLNWFDANTNTLSNVSSGVYDIYPMELGDGTAPGTRGLRILKGDTGDYYYVSYRQGLGNYGSLSGTYTQGLNIHRYSGSGYSNTRFIRALSSSQPVFDDPANSLTITQLGPNADGSMAVEVSVQCVQNAPSMNLSPSESAALTSEVASYTLNVTNNDATSCGSNVFGLSTESGSELIIDLPATTQSLSPGQSQTLTVSIQSEWWVGDGSYGFSLLADAGTPLSNNAAGTLVVDSLPPSSPALSASEGRKGRVELSWSMSTDSGSGVDVYQVERDGILIANTTSLSYTDSQAGSGTHSYRVFAVDAAGNTTGSNVVQITLGGSTGGGKGGGKKGGGGNGGCHPKKGC